VVRSDKGSGKTPSERVLRRLRGVGKVLGASFEGYEQRVMDLLMDIEARHQQKKDELLSTRRPSSSGRKYCRELKGLVSSMNYEAKASREAKGKDKVQGGDSMVVSMSVQILTWNVRGLNDPGKRLRIKHMLKDLEARYHLFSRDKAGIDH
jgi:hypothetical protein